MSNKRGKVLRSRKLHKKVENKFKTVLKTLGDLSITSSLNLSSWVSHLFHVSSVRSRVPAQLHSPGPERRSVRIPQPEPPVSCLDASNNSSKKRQHSATRQVLTQFAPVRPVLYFHQVTSCSCGSQPITAFCVSALLIARSLPRLGVLKCVIRQLF